MIKEKQIDPGCEIYVVDAMMGAGKTQGAINMINAAPLDERFLIVTPYLDEIKRFQKFCPNRNIYEPKFYDGRSKFENIKQLLKNGEDVATTHALFAKFDDEIVQYCKSRNYTLIMDEVADVIEEYDITEGDMKILTNDLADIEPETGKLIWRDDADSKDYTGRFNEEKILCKNHRLVKWDEDYILRILPVDVFCAFQQVYILTYRFDLQLQRYYYDLYGLKYTYLSVVGDSLSTYHFVDYNPEISYIKYDYSRLIHIIENPRMNNIGRHRRDLSKRWYQRNTNRQEMDTLKKNLVNFFKNIRHGKKNDNLWTTFTAYQSKLKGDGYTKGFLALNARATNEYRDRTSVAYTVNRYLNPFIKRFFEKYGITINEDGYALTEMLQFIWRSAIRDGKEIWIYIPSSRMRGLLRQWIKDNPLAN